MTARPNIRRQQEREEKLQITALPHMTPYDFYQSKSMI